MQFPLPMAAKRIGNRDENGLMPKNTPGLECFDAGVEPITDEPLPGIRSVGARERIGSTGVERTTFHRRSNSPPRLGGVLRPPFITPESKFYRDPAGVPVTAGYGDACLKW